MDKFPLAAPGWPYVIGSLAMACAATAFLPGYISPVFWLLFILITNFFRDPARTSDAPPEAVLSPADGRVVAIEEVDCPLLPGGRARLVSIFMNIFNVHVNRLPVSGTVVEANHRPGGFLPADRDLARTQNERLDLLLETPAGVRLVVTQVAGLIARRIVCRLTGGQRGDRGARYGMIRFGSRLDLYLPLDVKIKLGLGDKTKAGLTIIGEI